jgi:hypothetical protein
VRSRSPVLLVALVVAVAACSSGSDSTVETTIAEGPDTLYDVTTTVADGQVIAGGVADDVATGLGVTFTEQQRSCITGTLPAAAGDAAMEAYAANPVVLAQPQQVQDAIFAAVDGCVTSDGYAEIAAPGLVAAGASERSAECYFRTIWEELGSAALYAYFLAIDGETPDTTTPVSGPSGSDEPGTDVAETDTTFRHREAERVITRTYRTCGIDRDRLVTTTTEAATTTAADSTTSAG